MKRFQLKKLAMAMAVVILGFQSFAQGRIDLGGAKSAQQCTNFTSEGFSATFSFSSIEATEVSTEMGVFSNITMDGTYPAGNIGDPTIPTVNKLIAVPLGVDNVTVKVNGYTTQEYSLADFGISRLYPQQTPLRKDQKPEEVPFEYNAKTYAKKGYDNRPVAMFEIEGTMRGIQVGALTINPISYDASRNTVRVYNDIEVEVSFGKYDETAAYKEFARTFSPYFAGIYKTMFNYRQIMDVYDDHPDLWQNPVKMLVVANRMFEETIADWLAWKTEKGFYIDVAYTDEIGTTANAIKTYIQNYYAENAPTFLMIMGDKDQVPASATGSETQCVTDLYYMSADGDEFADMFHSRFPAETTDQMAAMLNKALEYEQLTMPDPSYLGNVLLIAGEDSGWGVTVGRPTIWYATNYYYNEDHGFANVYEYSHGTYTGCYNNLNTGVGFVNYTAHGSNTSWAGPSLTNSDVNNLTNEHKYFLAMGNCCQAADWGISGACFGETMVRAENKAAYAYIGSCPSTYWLNDYYFGVGATSRADGTMPSMEETTMGCYDAMWDEDAYNTVCAIPFVGNLAGNAAGALGYTLHISTLYCWQAYHTLGDGSILPFKVQPTDNEVSHLPTVPIGVEFYTVSAQPGSYVGISKDGVLYGAGMIDETGTTDIALTPITSGGDVKIVVTHQNHVPYVATVPAAALEGAYIAVDEYAMNVEQANFGETIDMTVDLKNVGADASGNLTAELTTESEYVEILAGEASASALSPDQIVTVEGFQFKVAANVPDGTKAQFFLNVTDGSDTWESKINITLHAPVLALSTIDNDGEKLTCTFVNNGSAAFEGGAFEVYSSSMDLTFAEATVTFDGVVEPECTIAFEMPYTIDEGVEAGTTFEVAYELSSGLYLLEGTTVISYGAIIEDFESGEFGEGWTFGSYPWEIVSSGAHTGTYCAHSTNAGMSSSESSMTLTVDVQAAGELTFWYKVSSEQNWDKLHFIVDNVEVDVWSGTVAWTEYTYAVTTGTHTFNWTYTKDSSVDSGEDCAWIDDIKFPPVNVITFVAPATDLVAEVEDQTVTLTWTASEEASSYIITRDGEQVGEVTETEFAETVDAGVYKYSVFASNDGGISKPVSTIVEVIFDGLIENQDVNVNIYPNPANDMLNVVTEAENYEYQLINSVGQVVVSGNANGNATINVSDLNGVYFLRIIADGNTIVRKVTVK